MWTVGWKEFHVAGGVGREVTGVAFDCARRDDADRLLRIARTVALEWSHRPGTMVEVTWGEGATSYTQRFFDGGISVPPGREVKRCD